MGGWSIYPPDPVLLRENVAPGLLISQLFLVALTSQTSSSSHGLAEGPRQSRESCTGHPWSEMLTARAESLDLEIVSHVWAEIRGHGSLKPIPEHFFCIYHANLDCLFFRAEAVCSDLVPCHAPSTAPDIRRRCSISDRNKFRINQSYISLCLFPLIFLICHPSNFFTIKKNTKNNSAMKLTKRMLKLTI